MTSVNIETPKSLSPYLECVLLKATSYRAKLLVKLNGNEIGTVTVHNSSRLENMKLAVKLSADEITKIKLFGLFKLHPSLVA